MGNISNLHLRILFILIVVSGVVGNGQTTESMASLPSQTLKIAFVTGNATKRFDIFQVNPDGSGLRLITQDHKSHMKWNCCPSWSPDGKELAFVSSDLPQFAKSHAAIFILNVMTDEIHALFQDDAACLHDPAWSPDAKHLVFSRGLKSRATMGRVHQYRTETCPQPDLFSINLDGSGLRRLTDNETASSSRPSWSPDNRTIAYVSRPKAEQAAKADIYLVDADGTNQRQLTKGGAAEVNVDPFWSPDGAEIVFSSNRNGNNEIYVMNRDGAHVRQLTHGTPGGALHPSWSPDGLQIVIGTEDASAIYIMNADGTNVRVLEKFAWHPDFGKWVSR
jgi:Tol biopolymer transport system component